MSLESSVERVHRSVTIVKAGVWTLFALVGPSVFLLAHNYLGVFLLGLISAAIGRFIFGPDMPLFKGSKLLGEVLLTQGLVYAVYGGYILFSPAAPWVEELGGTRTSLVIKPDGTIHGVELTESPSGFLTHHPTEKDWWRLKFPGDHIADAYLSEDGKTVVAPEDRSDRVYLLEGESFAMETRPKGKKAKRECEGVVSPPFVPDLCAKTPSGARYLASGSLLEGKLAFSSGGSKYESLSLPGPRPEALFPNPSNPDELWIAFWGSGVYRTLDRGKSWTLMGLRGSEVTSIVVDFTRKRAFASTGSGIFSLQFR